MGLYDNYRQANSQVVSQFVGSIVPEVSRAGNEARAAYEQAQDIDDKLTEAMGNLQHLNTDEDSQYANELKQKFTSRLQERSGRADYENLGRRTRRDAMQFTADYQPLVARQQAMSALVKKVQEDKDIFDPNTKAKILRWQQHQNGAKKDAQGNYVRDASGKIELGAIQELPYAKDVNAMEKMDKFLSTVEAQVSQGGYRTEGGLLISDISKVRDPKVLAVLGQQFLKSDPEVKAMLERDLMLATYDKTPAEFKAFAGKNSKSLYAQYRAMNLSEAEIKAQAIAMGTSVENLKVPEIEHLKKRAKELGQSEDQAYEAFYKDKMYQSLTAPTVALVAQKLKVDIHTLDARTDPEYAARATAKASADLDKAGNILMTDTNMEFIETNDSKAITNDLSQLKGNIGTVDAHIIASVATALGKTPLRGGFSKAERDNFLAIGKSKVSAEKAIKNLMAQGKTDEAMVLTKNIELKNNLAGQYALKEDQLYRRKYDPQAKARGVGYTMLTDSNPNGRLGAYAKELSKQANMGALNAVDMKTGKPIGTLVNDEYGDIKKRLGDKKSLEMEVNFTSSSAGGKPIAVMTMPDGSRRQIMVDGVPREVLTDAHISTIRDSRARNASGLTTYQQKVSAMALGEQLATGMSRAELTLLEPSSATHPIGAGYSVRVGRSNNQKTYRLIAGDGTASKPYGDANALYMDLASP